MSEEKEQREALRHAVLEALVARYPAALPVRGIVRRVAQEVDFTAGEVEVNAALAFLQESGLVKSQWDELGSSMWWSGTVAGVKMVERG